MVSSIGWKLNSLTPITGFGYRRVHHHHHRHTGHGIGRRAIGSLVGHLGHALVNRVSSAISGTGRVHRRRVHRAGSYRITGTGTTRRRVGRPRKPRSLLTSVLGGAHRRRRRTTGGRRTRRPRAPRIALFGTGRRHRRHHVLI
jgi:hypothetical protein